MSVTAKLLEATVLICDRPTINGRVYSHELMEREVARYKQRAISGTAFGPVNTETATVHLSSAQFITRGIRLEGSELKITVEPIGSARDIVAKAIKENRISPFGMGSVDSSGAVRNDYILVGFSIAPPEAPKDGQAK